MYFFFVRRIIRRADGTCGITICFLRFDICVGRGWQFPRDMDSADFKKDAKCHKLLYSKPRSSRHCYWSVRDSISGKVSIRQCKYYINIPDDGIIPKTILTEFLNDVFFFLFFF